MRYRILKINFAYFRLYSLSMSLVKKFRMLVLHFTQISLQNKVVGAITGDFYKRFNYCSIVIPMS